MALSQQNINALQNISSNLSKELSELEALKTRLTNTYRSNADFQLFVQGVPGVGVSTEQNLEKISNYISEIMVPIRDGISATTRFSAEQSQVNSRTYELTDQ